MVLREVAHSSDSETYLILAEHDPSWDLIS